VHLEAGLAAWRAYCKLDELTGRRFLAVHWDPSLPPEEAAAKAGAPVAWTEIATMPIEPPRRG
jgi:hypothetical protein